MHGLKITRLRVTNYRGVESLDTDVALGGPIPAGGFVLKGPNAAGKTSVLRALRAALIAQDIEPDAIRLGTDRAEIMVDLDCATVKRVITRKESTIDVREIDGEASGRAVRSSAKWLKELVGTSPFDPIEWFRLSPEKRRASLLAAIPIELPKARALEAIEAAAKSAGVLTYRDAVAIAEKGGHALTACAAIAKVFFDARTDVNRGLREAEMAAEHVLIDGPIPEPATFDCAAIAKGAAGALADLEGRARRAAETEAARSSAIAKIAELRGKARTVLSLDEQIRRDIDEAVLGAEATPDGQRRALVAEREGAAQLIEIATQAGAQAEEQRTKILAALSKIQNDLQGAKDAHDRASQRVAAAERAIERHDAEQAAAAKEREHAAERAKEWIAQADAMQVTIALAEEAPGEAEIETMRARVRATELNAEAEVKQAERRKVYATASAAADASRKQSEALTRAVDAFRDEIPRSLVAGASGIEGLSLEGDKVLLDGVNVDECSGMEQLKFAIEIARRANAKSKILVVDGLETLDPEHHARFLTEATKGGFQLIATRVDAGEPVFEAIQSEVTP